MSRVDWDKLGRVADSMSNMQAANRIPNIPDHIRVTAFSEALPEWIKTIRATYVKATGENPWKGQP